MTKIHAFMSNQSTNYLLSETTAFINGITLTVDGGASLASPAAIEPLAIRLLKKQPQPSFVFDGFHRSVPPRCLQEDMATNALKEKAHD